VTGDPGRSPAPVVDNSNPGGVDGEHATGLGSCAGENLLAVLDGAKLSGSIKSRRKPGRAACAAHPRQGLSWAGDSRPRPRTSSLSLLPSANGSPSIPRQLRAPKPWFPPAGMMRCHVIVVGRGGWRLIGAEGVGRRTDSMVQKGRANQWRRVRDWRARPSVPAIGRQSGRADSGAASAASLLELQPTRERPLTLLAARVADDDMV